MSKVAQGKKAGLTSIEKDLIGLVGVIITVFVFSYFFNIFSFLIDFIHKYPPAIFFIDEIVSVLLAVAIGLAVFSLRRLRELKIETSQRIKLQEKLTEVANIKAQAERIVSKQLQCEIELRKTLEG